MSGRKNNKRKSSSISQDEMSPRRESSKRSKHNKQRNSVTTGVKVSSKGRRALEQSIDHCYDRREVSGEIGKGKQRRRKSDPTLCRRSSARKQTRKTGAASAGADSFLENEAEDGDIAAASSSRGILTRSTEQKNEARKDGVITRSQHQSGSIGNWSSCTIKTKRTEGNSVSTRVSRQSTSASTSRRPVQNTRRKIICMKKTPSSKKEGKADGGLPATRPKRRASLEAHSAMVALTLQMQHPLSQSTAKTKSNGEEPPPRHRTKRGTATTKTHTDGEAVNSMGKESDLGQAASAISKQGTVCNKASSVCMCPPACPVHGSPMCTCHILHCHHAFHHPTCVAAQLSAAALDTTTQVLSANSSASFFPRTMGSSVTHCFPQQQSTVAWSTGSACSFALTALGTPGTETAAALGAIPAVFQGHLFIGPRPETLDIQSQHQQINLDTSQSATIFAASQSGCNLAFHWQQDQLRNQLAKNRLETKVQPSTVASSDTRKSSNCGEMLLENSVEKNKMGKAPVVLHMMAETAARKRRLSSSSSECSAKKRRTRTKQKSAEEEVRSVESSWESLGNANRKWVYLNNDVKPVRRNCFESIQHKIEGDVIRIRDCVMVNSGDSQLSSKRPYIGKIADFFCDNNGNLWASLAWYYWPEQSQVTSDEDKGILNNAHQKELWASRHVDCVAVDSIEDVAYVVTLSEYNRYIAENKSESSLLPPWTADTVAPRAWASYPRRRSMPADDTDDGLVFFSRRVYDFHGKRLLKNPSF